MMNIDRDAAGSGHLPQVRRDPAATDDLKTPAIPAADGLSSSARLSPTADLEFEKLLSELMRARAPSGQEEAVACICMRELIRVCDVVRTDDAGNVCGVLRPRATALGPPVCILAHMDEISMIVKRVEEDGSLVIQGIGGMEPGNFGQGPVDILGTEIIQGALGFGAMHVSSESKTWQIKGIGGNQPIGWEHARVATRHSQDELTKLGIRPGTRVVLSENRRGLYSINDCFAGFFMDNRAPLTAMLSAARIIRNCVESLSREVHFVATTSEEFVGTPGAAYAAINLNNAASFVAVDVVPVAEEYSVPLQPDPVVVMADEEALYHKPTSESLLGSCSRLGFKQTTAVLHSYRSDGSEIKRSGIAPKTALIGIPTCNTHGFEIIHRGAIPRLASVLADFVLH